MNKDTRIMAIAAVVLMTMCTVSVVAVFDSEETDAATYGSISEPLSSVDLTPDTSLSGQTVYVYVGSIVNIQLTGNYDYSVSQGWFVNKFNSETNSSVIVPYETGNHSFRFWDLVTDDPNIDFNIWVVGPTFGTSSNPISYFEMTGLTFLNVNPDDAYNDYGMDATEESLQNMFDSYREFYVQSGTRIDLEQFFIYYNDSNPYYLEVDFTSVTSGFGLNVRNDGITGTLNTGGDITVGVEITSYWGADFNATVSDSFIIHSIAQEVESVTISGATSGEVGDYIDLTATVDPSDADNPDVTWSITSGSTRATISSQYSGP